MANPGIGSSPYVLNYPFDLDLLNYPPYREQPVQTCINLATVKKSEKIGKECNEIISKVFPDPKASLESGYIDTKIPVNAARGWCEFSFMFQDMATTPVPFKDILMMKKFIYVDMPDDGISEKVQENGGFVYGIVRVDDHIIVPFVDQRNFDYMANNSIIQMENPINIAPTTVVINTALPFPAPPVPITVEKYFFFQRDYTKYPANMWRNEAVCFLCQKLWSTDENPITPEPGVITEQNIDGVFYDDLIYYYEHQLDPGGKWVHSLDKWFPYSVEILTCDGAGMKNYKKEGMYYIYRLRNRRMDVPFIFFDHRKLSEYHRTILDIKALPLLSSLVQSASGNTPVQAEVKLLVYETRLLQFEKWEPESDCGGSRTTTTCRWLSKPFPRAEYHTPPYDFVAKNITKSDNNK